MFFSDCGHVTSPTKGPKNPKPPLGKSGVVHQTNVFDGLAQDAIEEYRTGRTRNLRDITSEVDTTSPENDEMDKTLQQQIYDDLEGVCEDGKVYRHEAASQGVETARSHGWTPQPPINAEKLARAYSDLTRPHRWQGTSPNWKGK